MRIFRRLQSACFSLFLLAGAALAQTPSPQSPQLLQPALSPPALPALLNEALQRAEIPWYGISVFVQEAGSGTPLLTFNEATPMSPASTMKLVTTSAALSLLGPAYTWKTQAYASGRQTGDVLQGDLILRGGGDPKLLTEHLRQFLSRIRAHGIRDIRGGLVLDRGVFEEAPYDAATFDGEPMKPYNVGPDALLLNYKTLGFRFVPDDASARVNVLLDPPLAGYGVAPPRLAGGDCGDWRARLQPGFDASATRFNGAYAATCGERAWYIHPDWMSRTQYFSAVFQRIWAELGGTFSGRVRDGATPQDARLLTEWESPPLPEVIRDINKFSNNVMARQLLLTLAYEGLKIPANTERGAAVIKTWLAQKGIDAPDLIIDNGSGLSRREQISAQTMARVLTMAYRSPTMPEFIASLPLIGTDGTMRQRLTAQPVAGNGHIKTGTLATVRAAAGYLQALSGKRYIVVCLINHANAERGRDVIDTLLQWVYEAG